MKYTSQLPLKTHFFDPHFIIYDTDAHRRYIPRNELMIQSHSRFINDIKGEIYFSLYAQICDARNIIYGMDARRRYIPRVKLMIQSHLNFINGINCVYTRVITYDMDARRRYIPRKEVMIQSHSRFINDIKGEIYFSITSTNTLF